MYYQANAGSCHFHRSHSVRANRVRVLSESSFSQEGPAAASVDLNTATEKQLEQLPGVGPTTAKAIVEFRTKAGRFRRVEDLLVIRAISESKLKKPQGSPSASSEH